jgi:tetratricopeptide (TPR) repeat protein
VSIAPPPPTSGNAGPSPGPRRLGRPPVLLLAALAVTGAGIWVALERADRDPLADLTPAARAEMAVRAAESAAARGEFAAAERALLEATAFYEAAAAAEPGGLGPDRGRLAALDRLGQGALRQGDAAGALTYAKRALDVAVDVLARAPAGAEKTRAALDALATAHTYADRAERERVPAADVQRALSGAASAVDRAGSLAPAVAAPSARTWMRLARLSGDPASAAEAWQRAVAAAERVPPDAETIAVLAAAADVERPASAVAAHERALAAAARHVASHPGDPGAARLHEARLLGVAEAAVAAGRPAEATPRFMQVVESRRARLAAAHAADAPEVRRELSRALSNLGAHLSSQGDDVSALAAYREAVALSADLTGPARRTHLIALGNLAELAARGAEPGAALVHAEKALVLAAELSEAPSAGVAEAVDRAAATVRLIRLLRAPGGDRARARDRIPAIARAALSALDSAGAPPAGLSARAAELRTALTDFAGPPTAPSGSRP